MATPLELDTHHHKTPSERHRRSAARSAGSASRRETDCQTQSKAIPASRGPRVFQPSRCAVTGPTILLGNISNRLINANAPTGPLSLLLRSLSLFAGAFLHRARSTPRAPSISRSAFRHPTYIPYPAAWVVKRPVFGLWRKSAPPKMVREPRGTTPVLSPRVLDQHKT